VDRDDPDPRIPSADELAASLAGRVQQVLAAAEQSAIEIRARADEDAEERARDIRLAAEQDAERLLRRAEREAADYLQDARRRVDAFAAGRARRISAVADRLLAHAEALADRAQRAGRLHRGIEEVVDALAAAAEAVAAEAAREAIRLPDAHERSAHVTRLTTRPHAVPDPEPRFALPPMAVPPAPPEDADEDEARAHVREVADALPRRPGTPKPAAPAIVPPPEPPDVVA
jgi:cell division septum initiation protein DivIVA